MLQCDECELRYKLPDGGDEAVDELYRSPALADHEYWSNEAVATSTFERILEQLGAHLDASRRAVLDVGTGPGTFASLAQKAGFDVTAVEPNPQLAARARAAGVRVVDASMPGAPELEGRQFDAVTLLDVIEHVLDPVGLLRSCRSLLRPDGVLVVYTPNHAGAIARAAISVAKFSRGRVVAPVREIFDGPHVVFFDQRSLVTSLRAAGFLTRSVTFSPYEPARSQQATGVQAAAVRGIEALAPLAGGRFRMTATATPCSAEEAAC